MKSNRHAALYAALIGDALALGAHWIYDRQQIVDSFGRFAQYHSPLPGSYHPGKNKGQFTHYGDQVIILLQYLAAAGGAFSAEDFASHWRERFRDYQGYMDRASSTTLANMANSTQLAACGSASTDLGGPARMAALLPFYSDDPELLSNISIAQSQITHKGTGVVECCQFLSRSVCLLLDGVRPREAFRQTLDLGCADISLAMRLEQALEEEGDAGDLISQFGQACGLSAGLPGAVFTVCKYESNLEEALIENVMAGGDSAARGLVIGMLLGASLGAEAIPKRWLAELEAREEVEAALRTSNS